MNILELIARGEDQNTEFKRSLSEKREILETVCAFSNSNGGIILVGVDDDGSITGVDVGKSTVEELINDVKFSIEPAVIPQVEIVEVHGKKVLAISVSEGLNKPYFLKGVAFKRFGRTNQRITRDELERMILERHKDVLSFEERMLDVDLAEIDELKVRSFVSEVKSARNMDLPYSTVREFLERLGLFSNKPTAAALLCFSRNPQAYFSYAIVKCGRFRNGIADEKEIYGTLLDQVSGALCPDSDWNYRLTSRTCNSVLSRQKWRVEPRGSDMLQSYIAPLWRIQAHGAVCAACCSSRTRPCYRCCIRCSFNSRSLHRNGNGHNWRKSFPHEEAEEYSLKG
ncbi:MAG: hypothetical protein C0200_05120 [Thermoproteota archaeon]|nr:MAG: hypothetical protein C0200_05120 [Candidatus Korarchaeota archaeon]